MEMMKRLVRAKKNVEEGVPREGGNEARKDLHALAEMAKSGASIARKQNDEKRNVRRHDGTKRE